MFGLKAQQTIKKRTIALEDSAQIFRRHVAALDPVALEPGAFIREGLCQAADYSGNEFVGPFHGLPGLIHETSLDLLPSSVKIVGFRGGKQGCSRILSSIQFGSASERRRC